MHLPELHDHDVAVAGRDGRDAVELVREEQDHVPLCVCACV